LSRLHPERPNPGTGTLLSIYFKLDVARDRDVEGDLILADLGQGLPFRPGSFDGAISISALQWLCNADKTSHKPVQRLYRFFTTLYGVLVCNLCIAYINISYGVFHY
jgi:hypothetical protein